MDLERSNIQTTGPVSTSGSPLVPLYSSLWFFFLPFRSKSRWVSEVYSDSLPDALQQLQTRGWRAKCVSPILVVWLNPFLAHSTVCALLTFLIGDLTGRLPMSG